MIFHLKPLRFTHCFHKKLPFWFCSCLLIQILRFKKHFICSVLTNWLSGALKAAPTSVDLPSSHHGTNGLMGVKHSSQRHFLVTILAWKTWLSTGKNWKNSCKINTINNISLLFYTLQDLPTQWLDSPTSIINPENAPQTCPWPIWWWHFLNWSFRSSNYTSLGQVNKKTKQDDTILGSTKYCKQIINEWAHKKRQVGLSPQDGTQCPLLNI